MEYKHTSHPLRFLTGDSEMGRLIQAKNWSETPLGPPESWPQSLRTTLGIMLNSGSPMFLFWGKELICFYNDAYRPSLGNDGKHPHILGERAEDYLSELWSVVKTYTDKVLIEGIPVLEEDQLVPIYRNGRIEDVYWSYSYSPVIDETDQIAGVFVTCHETTQKVIAQKNLQESERKLRRIILQAPVAIGIFRGPDYVTELVNKQALTLLGRQEAEVMNKPILEVMKELEPQGTKDLLDHVYNTGETFTATELPVQLIRSNTLQTAYINFSYEPIYNSNGIIDGIMTVCFDVTPQVNARRNIEANEAKLKIIVDASELGTFDLNLKTDVVDCSPKFHEIFGFVDGEKLDHTAFLRHLHPEDVVIRNSAFDQAFIKGILHYESRIIAKDKSIRWIEVKGKLFYDELNQPEWIIGTCADITIGKTYQQELEERESRFRLLADAMPQLVWVATTEGIVNFFNQRIKEFDGARQLPDGTWSWHGMIHHDDLTATQKAWSRSLQLGTEYVLEHKLKLKNGAYRWFLTMALPQKDAQGNIIQWYGASTDIQDQKSFTAALEKQVEGRTNDLSTANQLLMEKNNELETMNKELKSFAYVASHDLQEPLRKIQSFAARIMEKELDALSDHGKDQFRRMQNAAQRMQKLIEDLLLYSRTNTTERNYEKINLYRIIEDLKQQFKEELLQKNATIEAFPTEQCEAKVIVFQLRQVFHNLISNALKFSRPDESPCIKIKSRIEKGANLPHAQLNKDQLYCHINFSDNGIGFESKFKERIFEIFQRLHGRSEYSGTGIGLAIVKKIVENHNGYVTANGEINKGATFDIYIPA